MSPSNETATDQNRLSFLDHESRLEAFLKQPKSIIIGRYTVGR